MNCFAKPVAEKKAVQGSMKKVGKLTRNFKFS
jgi:hypothetical protein